SETWRNVLLAAALVSATFLAYTPAIQGGLVWDDASHITAPDLRSLQGLWRIWFEPGATQQYYPLLHSAFWLEHKLWGDSVLGYHAVNILLHAIAALLVAGIMRRLSLPGAWLGGFLFALHPVCVESVAWISEQKSTLSGVFYLAAALTYLNFDRTRRKQHYWLALGLFLLALLSKTVTATLPAALLVVLWWMRGRLQWRRDVAPLLPWFALGVPAGLFTAWVEKTHIGAQGAEFALSLPQRILLAGRVPWFYASKVVWPFDLMFSYPRWEIDPRQWWQYLYPAALIAVAAILLRLARNNRAALAGFLFFVGTLFPVLGFLNVYPFRYSYVADHFQYLAMLGILVPAAAGLARFPARMPAAQVATSILMPLALGVLSWQQSGAYRDVEALYRQTLARNPAAFFVRLNLGSERFKQGRVEEAAEEFEQAVRLKPDSAEALENLGNALAALPGRLPEAVATLRKAIEYNPRSAEIHNNLGLALLSLPGHQEEAAAAFRRAIQLKPDFAPAHNNLGLALASMPGRLEEAIAEYQMALKIDPNYAAAYNNLGTAYSRIPGRAQDAIAAYRAALRANPDFAMAHFNLANVLSEIPGRTEEAVEEYRAALRIDPAMVEAHVNLGLTLAQVPGRLPEAIASLQQALRIRPGLEPAQQILVKLEAAQRGTQR
ncbi:MAG: tetratricopeptide repeat protein, partial [Bryobacteraceae bacterium]|nr:tetratricopeptide repeat protein [Bryobacteraceae bacterium]